MVLFFVIYLFGFSLTIITLIQLGIALHESHYNFIGLIIKLSNI